MKNYGKLLKKLCFLVPFLPLLLQAYPVERPQRVSNSYSVQPKILTSDYYYPPHTLFIYSIQVNGESIILYDGSEWKINRNHAPAVRDSWWKDNPIVISPTTFPCFSGSRFYITNLITGEWVYAEPIVGPIVGGAFTNRIVSLDYYYGTITIVDGRGVETSWEVNPNDLSMIQDWYLEQGIMLGTTDDPMSSWTSTYDIMLLNIEMNRTVRARRI